MDHAQLQGVRMDIPADKHICHKVYCITQRGDINKPIIWSVTAADTGFGLSWLVLATDNTFICQECAASPAKASST